MENEKIDYLYLTPTENGYSTEISEIENKVNEIIKHINENQKVKCNLEKIAIEEYLVINDEKIPINTGRKIKKAYKKDGKWCIEFDMSVKETIKKYNDLMPKEKIIEWLSSLTNNEMLFCITYLDSTSKDADDFKSVGVGVSDKNIKGMIEFINNNEIGIKSIERIG